VAIESFLGSHFAVGAEDEAANGEPAATAERSLRRPKNFIRQISVRRQISELDSLFPNPQDAVVKAKNPSDLASRLVRIPAPVLNESAEESRIMNGITRLR
jgi:hypothetical protein